ncbi:hypothetical protein N6L26_05420 [Qipengyuania sp. SS22]|uniref:hypothetical protein n=1 Tax=Qipengyuania sp. SS22 TaxID=2979461 RepID=UPI0021E5E1CF|nr:hypothetical protein [Qipengyuania sp. SS22]UYH55995.1 hypothetical protein N6L26_05420 [Qipengyuania sp. SS22]
MDDPNPDTAPTQHPHTPRGTLPDFTPVPRLRERSNGWKPQVQRAFIEALADTGSVASACRRVGRAEVGAYLLRRHPEAASFRKAWEVALDLGMRRIEDVAMDRALNGVEVPVYSYGKLVGSRTVHNDRLLMFMLRNRAPERFAEGKPKGLNAVGKMETERLKKQWRKEWEAERNAGAGEEEAETLRSLNTKLNAGYENWYAQLSPRTRAAWEEYKRLEALDQEEGYLCYDDPEHELYDDPDARWDEVDEAMPLPAPERGVWEAPEEPAEDDGPRCRTIKDDGWD